MSYKNPIAGIIVGALFLIWAKDGMSAAVGKITCKNIGHVFSRLSDGRPAGFCLDADRDCKTFENLENADKKDPLTLAVQSFFSTQLQRNLQLCSFAVMTYDPSYYSNLSDSE